MTTNAGTLTGSAKIYAFPPRGRYAIDAQRGDLNIAHTQLPPGAKLAVGSAWYHDQAIESTRKGETDH
jgi:hypothetical protein